LFFRERRSRGCSGEGGWECWKSPVVITPFRVLGRASKGQSTESPCISILARGICPRNQEGEL
jgi:hypothetical protein